MNTRRINTSMLPMNDPFFIGFDSVLNKLNSSTSPGTNYPPYNIIKHGDDEYLIEIAVAGFGEEDMEITLHDGTLTVTGEIKSSDSEPNYLHRGIAARAFSRKFTLADTIEVIGAQIYNGMLQIRLQNIIPESKKPKTIPIGAAKTKELLVE
jgi:molecular chaperone IbpA